MHVDDYSRTKLPDSDRALDFSKYWNYETRFFYLRNRHRMRFSLLLLTLRILGCQSGDNTPVDPFHLPPFVKSLTVSPLSINTDTINIGPQRLPTDSLRIAVKATVQVSDPEGLSNVNEVTVRVFKPASQDLIRTAQLFDNGTPPDASSGDGTFSGVVQFAIIRSDIGDFKVEVTATNNGDLASNSLSASVSVLRLNKPPTTLEPCRPRYSVSRCVDCPPKAHRPGNRSGWPGRHPKSFLQLVQARWFASDRQPLPDVRRWERERIRRFG